MIPYGAMGTNAQRNAIVQALMNVANPPPATGMPGPQMNYGATANPTVLAPPAPTAPGMPGGSLPGAAGMPGQAPSTPSPAQASNPQGGPNPQPFFPTAPYTPQSPRQVIPPTIGGPQLGPMPNSQNLIGQPPPMSGAMPGTQLPIDPTGY